MSRRLAKNLTDSELSAWLEHRGQAPFRAAQIRHWLYRRWAVDFTAMANLLSYTPHDVVTTADYFNLLKVYTTCHQLTREDGRIVPWIDENLNPRTGDARIAGTAASLCGLERGLGWTVGMEPHVVEAE